MRDSKLLQELHESNVAQKALQGSKKLVTSAQQFTWCNFYKLQVNQLSQLKHPDLIPISTFCACLDLCIFPTCTMPRTLASWVAGRQLHTMRRCGSDVEEMVSAAIVQGDQQWIAFQFLEVAGNLKNKNQNKQNVDSSISYQDIWYEWTCNLVCHLPKGFLQPRKVCRYLAHVSWMGSVKWPPRLTFWTTNSIPSITAFSGSILPWPEEVPSWAPCHEQNQGPNPWLCWDPMRQGRWGSGSWIPREVRSGNVGPNSNFCRSSRFFGIEKRSQQFWPLVLQKFFLEPLLHLLPLLVLIAPATQSDVLLCSQVSLIYLNLEKTSFSSNLDRKTITTYFFKHLPQHHCSTSYRQWTKVQGLEKNWKKSPWIHHFRQILYLPAPL